MWGKIPLVSTIPKVFKTGVCFYSVSPKSHEFLPFRLRWLCSSVSITAIPLKDPRQKQSILRQWSRADSVGHTAVKYQSLFSNFLSVNAEGERVRGEANWIHPARQSNRIHGDERATPQVLNVSRRSSLLSKLVLVPSSEQRHDSKNKSVLAVSLMEDLDMKKLLTNKKLCVLPAIFPWTGRRAHHNTHFRTANASILMVGGPYLIIQ